MLITDSFILTFLESGCPRPTLAVSSHFLLLVRFFRIDFECDATLIAFALHFLTVSSQLLYNNSSFFAHLGVLSMANTDSCSATLVLARVTDMYKFSAKSLLSDRIFGSADMIYLFILIV